VDAGATSGARDRESGGPGPGDASGQGASLSGLDGVGADPYPDLDVRRPAPTVDATRRDEQRGPRYEERPDDVGHERADSGARRATGDPVERAVEDMFRQGSDLSAYDAEIDRVVDRLYREVERKMRIERERRGLR
jgi:hypothetical protein